MNYSNAQPVKYEKAISRAILRATDRSDDERSALALINSTGVHRRGQVMVAHGGTQLIRGTVLVEWHSPDLRRYRITYNGNGKVSVESIPLADLLGPML